MSLDGYIADSEGVTVSGPSDWASFAINAKQYKNFVIGRGTNRNGGLDNIDCEYRVMVSSRPYDNANFVTATSPEDVLHLLKGKVETVYLVGGGKLNASFAKAGLIDELVVTIVPRILGSGTRLFGDSGVSLSLKLLDRKSLDDGRVQLTYQVKK